MNESLGTTGSEDLDAAVPPLSCASLGRDGLNLSAMDRKCNSEWPHHKKRLAAKNKVKAAATGPSSFMVLSSTTFLLLPAGRFKELVFSSWLPGSQAGPSLMSSHIVCCG